MRASAFQRGIVRRSGKVVGRQARVPFSAESLEGRTLLAVTPYFGIGTQSSGAFSGVGASAVFYYMDGGDLWKSDGTAAGTAVVKSVGATSGNIANVNGTIYFAGSDVTHSVEIWKTNGTAAGTVMVKGAIPGSAVEGVAELLIR